MSGAASIRLESASRRYRAPGGGAGFELSEASLEVQPASWTVFTGRSGSGKTTLLQLMAGLDRADSGRVFLFGRDVTKDSEGALARLRRKHLGIVHQQARFIEHLPVWQNVSVRLVPQGVRAGERRARAEAALERLGLEGFGDRLPRSLSGGEQQRVSLARAGVAAPEVILADEPTSDVDAETGATVLAYLSDLRAGGAAVVVSTHDPAMMAPADQRVVLDGGRIVREGEQAEP